MQTLAPDELRGRVTGVYSLAAFGSLPLGGLAAGAMAEWLSPVMAVLLGAGMLLVFAVGLVIFFPQLRKVE